MSLAYPPGLGEERAPRRKRRVDIYPTHPDQLGLIRYCRSQGWNAHSGGAEFIWCRISDETAEWIGRDVPAGDFTYGPNAWVVWVFNHGGATAKDFYRAAKAMLSAIPGTVIWKNYRGLWTLPGRGEEE